ncbi:hypothetical protein [Sphingobacterium daejeonense]|uniref:hypothetical protein n=1 Tax=Sphingobacterium daejeonense TaxID=371142 RepID=UPI0010C39825|nr:hypothetical protein [Sphingobacterium daejeonense]VTQ01576.1 Uncharacterised protein [Sphingobacterium daejeonense]
MTISQLFKKVLPFTKPYKNLIFYTLILTVIGSFAAQVNAFILKYTVDTISDLLVNKTHSERDYIFSELYQPSCWERKLYIPLSSSDRNTTVRN